MSFNREFEVNEEQTADYLQNIVRRVKESENVEVLADLSKLFKKNVPLSLRKYVIACMLKDSLKHYRPFTSSNRRNDRNSRNRNEYKSFKSDSKQDDSTQSISTESEERPRHQRVEIPEDESVSIFVSIGKNRRVYPRDLVGILIAIGGLNRDRIGDIKVLANYSFVQLYKDDAQQAIDKLNGYDYRGRKLAVSYSKQKEETDDSSQEDTVSSIDSGYESANTDMNISDAEMSAEDAAAYAAAEKAAADKEPFGV